MAHYGSESRWVSHSGRSSHEDHHGKNVGGLERAVSGLVGAALATWGLRRRDTMGTVGIAAGTALLLRGATGFSLAKEAVTPSPLEREIAERHGWSSAAVTSHSIVIDKPREEIYQLWRNFQNLPRFMDHIERVDIIDDRRSHWVVQGPGGKSVEWVSTVTEDRPNEYIAWEADRNAEIRNAGWVEFRPANGKGTKVKAVIAYEPPGGQLGRLAAKLFGREPGMQTRHDLRRLKQLLESGEQSTAAARQLTL